MPRNTAHKTRAHARIVEAAVRALLARGVERVSIAEVMRDAGLTHGGFYAHFANKEALVAEATTTGMREARRAFVAEAAAARPEAPLREIIRRYISRAHRDDPAHGCAMPALAADMAREPEEARRAFTIALQDYVAHLTPYLPGETEEARRDAALALLAGMAGSVALARAVDDPALSNRLLLATRRFYTDMLAAPAEAATSRATEAGE